MSKIKKMIKLLKLKFVIDEMKKMLKVTFFQIVIAEILAIITYKILIKTENGIINIGNIIVISLISLVVLLIIIKKFKKSGNGCLNCSYSKSCNKIKCK